MYQPFRRCRRKYIVNVFAEDKEFYNFKQKIFMSKQYPLRFTLEDGIKVVVNKTGNNTYDFTLDKHGAASHFTYVNDGRPKSEIDAGLDFDQLNAVRRFWLETEDVA